MVSILSQRNKSCQQVWCIGEISSQFLLYRIVERIVFIIKPGMAWQDIWMIWKEWNSHLEQILIIKETRGSSGLHHTPLHIQAAGTAYIQHSILRLSWEGIRHRQKIFIRRKTGDWYNTREVEVKYDSSVSIARLESPAKYQELQSV